MSRGKNVWIPSEETTAPALRRLQSKKLQLTFLLETETQQCMRKVCACDEDLHTVRRMSNVYLCLKGNQHEPRRQFLLPAFMNP